MWQLRKISSLFFLSIFSMFMLHQVLPHVHHQHDGLETSIEQSEHFHLNHEHDHEGKESKDDSSDFLGFLLGSHSHNYQSSDYQQVRNITKQNIIGKKFLLFAIPESIASTINESGEYTKPLVHLPPDKSTSPYLSIQSPRGPPILG